ncbi:GIY-YIG nuclease family protein [Candidatus Gottesmanbacteria bacterium]|nr:GIY-YIG nuclease family protein [Candidatus Gottesmanbacteria bacterium]
MIRHYFVYILASKRNGTLYIGVTNNIAIRSLQHKLNILDGFTKKYKVHILVYYEIYVDIKEAIKREKQLKWWRREWKTKLIEEKNPKWEDLYRKIIA